MIEELVDRAVHVSQAVAEVLAAIEASTRHREEPVSEALVASLARKSFRRNLSIDPDRAARLIAQWWSRLVHARSARRPDVLAITCDLLTNPEVPFTRDVARFAVSLGLRYLYDIDYSTESLSALRNAHSDLHYRFEQQERRRTRKNERLESFIVDLACMDGAISRSATGQNLSSYYRGFRSAPLGVGRKRVRGFAGREWPELRGSLPDFPAVMKWAFAQPTCIAGLDEVVQGLLAAVPHQDSTENMGGLVTLVAGPPGSGKTSFCLTLASRMAELGSQVSYLATEEAPYALHTKLVSVVDPNYLATALLQRVPGAAAKQISFIDGRSLVDFEQVTQTISAEFALVQRESKKRRPGLYLVFPRVLVVDSLTALVHGRAPEVDIQTRRQKLAGLLATLRHLGVCVFLVGGATDCEDEGLAYLVDNVFVFGTEQKSDHSHTTRIFNVSKTRLQSSYRGRHVLHLSRTEGCMVSPSLHSVSRSLHGLPEHTPDVGARALIWARERTKGSPKYLAVSAHSQTLVYGRGSAGKARFAMALACEPRQRVENEGDWLRYVSRHIRSRVPSAKTQPRRVLVVSFLYGARYYEAIVEKLLALRGERLSSAEPLLRVMDQYPGFLDPETLVAKIGRALQQGRLEGRPYNAVVIDGIHNMLLQFPLLEKEPLLWPTLYRLLRAEAVDAISTFTFFKVPFFDKAPGGSSLVPVSQDLFFHLLVGNCDYSFNVERPDESLDDQDELTVTLASSLEAIDPAGRQFQWSPVTMRFV